jgi:hypothetical protein
MEMPDHGLDRRGQFPQNARRLQRHEAGDSCGIQAGFPDSFRKPHGLNGC